MIARKILKENNIKGNRTGKEKWEKEIERKRLKAREGDRGKIR